MNYPQRMYSKTELGLLYFPDTTDGATARRHIMVWIKRCEAGGIKKNRQAFLSTPGGLDISQNKNLVFLPKLGISSSVLPLVSGTSFHTKMAARIQITPYRP